jgi:hypothetical protein
MAAIVLLAMGLLSLVSARAASKYTMPDIDQDENTCFPAACSNLIYWFGENGYPKLLSEVATPAERQRKLIAELLVNCQATFKVGTDMDSMTSGLAKFFKSKRYPAARVSYRGLPEKPVKDLALLDLNGREDTGFILCLAYLRKKGNEYSLWAGHAVTLMRYEKGVAVVLDPAHASGDGGRKTVRFQPLTNFSFTASERRVSEPIGYEMQGLRLPDDSPGLALLVGVVMIEMPPVSADLGK